MKPIYQTVWKIVPGCGSAKAKFGKPIIAGESIVVVHCATNQYLSNDHIPYTNDFGSEMEVSVKTQATMSKTQMLAGEYNGEKVREDVGKSVAGANFWTIELADSEQGAEPVAEAPRYDGAQMIQDIKETLKKRGAMEIRGIGRVFRILDDNRNRQLDKNELMWGLKDFDIHLSEE